MVYIIECKKCGDQYIGQTGRETIRKRFLEHLGYAWRKENKSTGIHFNLPGHSITDMTISVLEQVNQNNRLYREARESYIIEKFNLKYQGMNRKKWHLLIAKVFKNH